MFQLTSSQDFNIQEFKKQVQCFTMYTFLDKLKLLAKLMTTKMLKKVFARCEKDLSQVVLPKSVVMGKSQM